MTQPASFPERTLRRRAEDRVDAMPDILASAYPRSMEQDERQLLHELQVHQVELEMQNEQLLLTQVELDATRARYFDLFDMAPMGYCTVSEQGQVLEANFTAATMLECSRSDMVHKPISRFIVQSDQDHYYKRSKALLESGTAQECDLQLRKFDGSPLWVHLKISAAKDANGAQIQRMALNDIDSRKRMDAMLAAQSRELAAARAVADRANRAKSDFLSNMTHELRSPLNAILGFAQLIDQGTPAPTPSQKSSVEQILKAGWYLLDLIGEILDLTSIESGKLALALGPITLADVMQDCKDLMTPDARKKNIELHFAPLAQTVCVSADGMRLKQVMINLLSNAIKYNNAGGTVEVSVTPTDGDRLRISVHDTGQGLSAEQISHLFQPFNRLGRETRAEEGTGIGLAVSKRLVELMGGTIGAQSTVGAGSVFWFELNSIRNIP